MPRDPNALYAIEVRKRPLNDKFGKYFADHVYLALVTPGTTRAIDTASFDPKNSTGGKDSIPDGHDGSEHVTMMVGDEEWETLKANFHNLASKSPYNLGSHNCCHAVKEALTSSSFRNNINGSHVKRAVAFANDANKLWHNANNAAHRLTSYLGHAPRTDGSLNLPGEDYVKKKQ